MNQCWWNIIWFLLSVVLTYAVRKYALKRAILDIPNHRSSHKVPTPRGGGVGFVVIFYLALWVLWMQHLVNTTGCLALLGGVAIAVIGYIDDRIGVRSALRALVHVLAAIWGVVWLGGALHFDFGAFVLPLGWLGFVVAVFVTVWLVNLYNFMDGIDGIAASEAVFVALAAGGVLYYVHSNLMYLCFMLAAVMFGFLVWNWPPAKIFMGDIGSGFLGYIFAMLMWMTNQQHSLSIPFWVILLALFLCDATYTLIRRVCQRKKWYEAHREHVYQRLVQNGFKHWQVTSGVIILNLVICLPLALGYFKMHGLAVTLCYLIGLILLSVCIWGWLVRRYVIVG